MTQGGIEIRNAVFGYGAEPIINGASLNVCAGETAVVTGMNGSGKSTLLYLSAGLLPFARGSVVLGGQFVDTTRPSELFRRGIRCGVVFQEGGLLSNMSALANVALALHYHADILNLTPKEVEQRAREALERVQIREPDHLSYPAHLSFGVRKRLALARAIALRPNFFFFDDPDVGLDPGTAALVHEILCQFRDDPQVTMIVATNRDILIDRLKVPGYVLQTGKLFERHARVA
jgi:phospholipid/cholesterol/gamma-HCH transport system ATP-binding protein